jgi:xanthine dehydrogenase accessory factor
MREVLPEIDRWHAEGQGVALATVVKVWGSAPRGVGAKMAVSGSGQIAGSVSGGCVEGAVVEAAGRVLAEGTARRLRFGVTDETAWSVGLSCGGEIEILVERWERGSVLDELAAAVRGGRLAAVATVLTADGAGPRCLLRADGAAGGSLGSAERDGALEAQGKKVLSSLRATRIDLADGGELLVDVIAPPRKLVIVGAVHTAVALVALAREVGFRTYVVDPRGVFATPERFVRADRLIASWPAEAFPEIGLDEATAVAVLAHDLKLDVPALQLALASPVPYVGVLGSRKTQAKRLAALREAGVAEADLARLHSPIGLDLGGRSPEEIALAILAEVVAVLNGGAASTPTPAPTAG